MTSATFITNLLHRSEPYPIQYEYLPDNPLERLEFLKKFFSAQSPLRPFTEPFTEKQREIFQNARRWESINNWTLSRGLFVCALLATTQTVLQLKPVQDWASNSSKNNSTIFSLTALCGFFGVVISYLATGNIPDKASTNSDREMKDFDRIKAIYEDVAFRLLDMYGNNREEAKTIACGLEVDKIQKAMQRWISEEDAKELCESLVFAKEAVTGGEMNASASPLFLMKWELMSKGYLSSSGMV